MAEKAQNIQYVTVLCVETLDPDEKGQKRMVGFVRVDRKVTVNQISILSKHAEQKKAPRQTLQCSEMLFSFTQL